VRACGREIELETMIFGFSIASALAIYFVIWWIVLFAVLPFGVRTQAEAGEVTRGTISSAPRNPLLLRKVLATTAVAALVFALFAAVMNSGLTIKDIPLPGYDA
jgi:predicted secreted protein